MRKVISSLVVAGLALAPAVASAQARAGATMNVAQPTEGTRFGLGAGLILPLGDYSTGDGLGFHGMGLVQIPLHNTPVHLRADIMVGTTSHKNNVSGSTTLIGGTVDALYHMGEHSAPLRPYILGGLGYYNVKISGTGGSVSSSAVAFGFGGGALFGIGTSMHAFVEARYMSVQTSPGSIAFIPITFGLMFN